MTKLSDTKTHLLLRLANVRPIAMPGRIAKAGPGNKRTVDSLTRTGYIGTDGKLTTHGLYYVHRILAAFRAVEMAEQAKQADADAAPYTLNTDPTGLRPEATDAERMAHFARNIVADQEQRDADALAAAAPLMEVHDRWQRRIKLHDRCSHVNGPADEDARDRCDAGTLNGAARWDGLPPIAPRTLTRKLARLAYATLLDVFTPSGDAGVVSMVGRKDDRVYVTVSLGEGERDASGWYPFEQITPGADLLAATKKRSR